MRREESDSQTDANAEERNTRVPADRSCPAKSYPEMVTEWTPVDGTIGVLNASMVGLRYDKDPVKDPNCCQRALDATEIITATLEKGPLNTWHLQMTSESEVQKALSEEDLPNLLD